MAYGKRFDEWDRASLLAAVIHNAQGGKADPSDFNPFTGKPAAADETALKITDPRDLVALLGGTVQIVT